MKAGAQAAVKPVSAQCFHGGCDLNIESLPFRIGGIAFFGLEGADRGAQLGEQGGSVAAGLEDFVQGSQRNGHVLKDSHGVAPLGSWAAMAANAFTAPLAATTLFSSASPFLNAGSVTTLCAASRLACAALADMRIAAIVSASAQIGSAGQRGKAA